MRKLMLVVVFFVFFVAVGTMPQAKAQGSWILQQTVWTAGSVIQQREANRTMVVMTEIQAQERERDRQLQAKQIDAQKEIQIVQIQSQTAVQVYDSASRNGQAPKGACVDNTVPGRASVGIDGSTACAPPTQIAAAQPQPTKKDDCGDSYSCHQAKQQGQR